MTGKPTRGKILLVEDDLSLTRGLIYALGKADFDADSAETLTKARELISRKEYALILLDINLPDGSGLDFCRDISRVGSPPVIFLTANDDEVSVVMGLDMGADDYICKPFRVNELISRVGAVLRRTASRRDENGLIQAGNITLDNKGARLKKEGKEIPLTATEYRLVSLLLGSRGSIVTREMLLEQLWDRDENFVDGNTLSVYISRLREKLGRNSHDGEYIETVRGVGYRWA